MNEIIRKACQCLTITSLYKIGTDHVPNYHVWVLHTKYEMNKMKQTPTASLRSASHKTQFNFSEYEFQKCLIVQYAYGQCNRFTFSVLDSRIGIHISHSFTILRFHSVHEFLNFRILNFRIIHMLS